jgi:iron complex transport system ATP-binding protein
MIENRLNPILAIEVPIYSYNTGFKLQEIRLLFPERGLIALVGPNGSGKSTLLRLAAGLIGKEGVRVAIQGVGLHEIPQREVARMISWVPQRAEAMFSMTVREMVRVGRYRWNRPFRPATFAEEKEIGRAVAEVGLAPLIDREVDSLSGGEWQRALIARAVAQDTPVMLLDEPIAGLDLRYQEEVYLLLHRLAADGRLIIVADHHLEVAASHAERIVMLDRGRIVADGSAAKVLTPERIAEVFGVNVQVFPDPVTGSPRLSRPAGHGRWMAAE